MAKPRLNEAKLRTMIAIAILDTLERESSLETLAAAEDVVSDVWPDIGPILLPKIKAMR